MKTQISRHSFRPESRYSGVYQQQGRMITDADWNELVDILKTRLDDAARDAMASGSPRQGGARLFQTAAGQPIRILPGRLYAGGVGADVRALPGTSLVNNGFLYNQQADFPSPPPLPINTAYTLYADIWERVVTAIEDPQDAPHLLDPALQGSDTTSRSQTVAQIKWCPATIDPEASALNPTRGNAPLTLVLRARREEADPCDPCADEVEVNARTGNYLFRLEVHDVQGAANAPDRILIKWSTENGAEQYALGSEPPGFTTGDWTYEFHTELTDRHLGVHLASGAVFSPFRGLLIDHWPVAPSQLGSWVRRWDGYCELQRSGGAWSLVQGMDRAVTLTLGGAADGHGHVGFVTNGVEIQLETLVLTLAFQNRSMVVGDYWLAAVREAIHGTGATVLGSVEPVGVTHRYVRLGNVAASGTLTPLNTAESRRLAFPPLSDLAAGDVGYQTTCSPPAATPLFDTTHDTVRKALDRLCQLAAEHIAYSGTCTSGLFDSTHNTVQKALDRLCQLAAPHVAFAPGTCSNGLFTSTHNTVDAALQRLCQLAAGHVGYSPLAEAPDLAGATTAAAALDALSRRPLAGTVSTLRRDIAQANHGFQVGDAIRFDGATNRFVRARANTRTNSGLFLVAGVNGTAGFTLVQAGFLDLAAGYSPLQVPSNRLLTPGQIYYVSATTDGQLTSTEPLNTPSNPILLAVSQTAGYVLPWQPLDLRQYVDQLRTDVNTLLAQASADTTNLVNQANANTTNLVNQLRDDIDTLLAGSVSAFAMASPPTGWLECNAQAVSRTTFSRLFSKIGTTYGSGNGSTTFNVPDLRGEFIRGWASNGVVDAGRALGSAQGHALQAHQHNAVSHTHQYSDIYYSENYNSKPSWVDWTSTPGGSGSHGGHDTDNVGYQMSRTTGSTSVGSGSVATGATTATETRPRNRALMYCIKY